MSDYKASVTGLILLFIFICLSMLANNVGGWVYSRLKISVDVIIMLLWIIPVIAAFLAVFTSPGRGSVACLFYIMIITVAFPVINAISGYFIKTDFSGLSGMTVTLKIFFFLSACTISIGGVLGYLARKIAG